MKRWRILGGAAAVLMYMLAVTPVYAKETKIPEGIYVGEFSLGGMTEKEAEDKVGEYVDSLADREVTLEIDGKVISTTAEELGFAWSNREAVDEATKYAVSGNLVQQYMELKDLEKEPIHLPLETAVDGGRVEAFVQQQGEGLTAEPQNATITRNNGAFEITPGVAGVVVDIEATKRALDEALAGESSENVSVKVVMMTKQPDITEDQLSTIGDVLGTFSTDFSSSGTARSKNLTNGAAKINGHLLMPGQTLSGYECMHPFTTGNGYYTAAAYENGQVVDSVGGGVCQIATTLYNAALRAELEITQRQNHSMIVTYVKPSMDAAIAGTYKDIKITNNYSTPIYVEGGTSGRTLTFTIYGKETRPANRTVEYVSETLSVTDPGAPEQRVDNSLRPGQTRRVQSSHKGLKSRLWKVVSVDGVETERTLLHTDTYNASKAIVLVGPVSVQPVETVQLEETEAPAIQPEETAPSTKEAAPVEGIHGGPGVAGTAPAPEPVPQQTTTPSPESEPEPALAPASASAPASESVPETKAEAE